MPRKRDISPELWGNEQLALVCRDARLLFIACISQADDEGRLKGSARWLRAQAFAYDDDIVAADVERWIVALADAKLVCRYEVDGESYLHLPTWHKWQSVNRRMPPRYPPCPAHGGEHPADPEPAPLSESDAIPPDDSVSTHAPLTEHSLSTHTQPYRTVPYRSVPESSRSSPLRLNAPGGAREPIPKTKRERTAVTAEDIEALVVKYADRYGGSQPVRDEVDLALNHTARFKALNERLYVDGWLRRELQHRPQNVTRNGRIEPPRHIVDRTGAPT